MSEYVLYLLGAGASSQVLPVASAFAGQLDLFAKTLNVLRPRDIVGDSNVSSALLGTWGRKQQDLLNAIKWLAEESSRHISVDTFAKKLFFLNDGQNLKKLKAALSAYLVIEQSRQHVDKRYDAFFASILQFDSDKQRVFLPKHLRILTWNYDTQLEKAFYGFCKDKNRVIEEVTSNKHIYRINGCCGTHLTGQVDKSFNAVLNTTINPAWAEGINLYNAYMADPLLEPGIHFAWEDPTRKKLEDDGSNLLSQLSETADIVMIGYSFPYFNREIDDSIFKQFFHVNRVYLQYPEGVHASIKERIQKILPSHEEIIEITGTDLFYIPDDF